MKIHPSAIVSSSAKLAEDVEIGPYAIIGGDVTLGPGCVIQAHAVLESKVTMGAGNFVGYGAGVNHLGDGDVAGAESGLAIAEVIPPLADKRIVEAQSMNPGEF